MRGAILILMAAAASPGSAERAFGEPVGDAELAATRGGFAIGNGMDVSMVVRTETSVDGQLLLRSVYALSDSAPSFELFAPAPGQNIATTSGGAGAGAGHAAPKILVTFDRQNGVEIASRDTPRPNVTVTTGTAAAPRDDGLRPLPIAPGGSVQAAGGTVTLEELPAGAVARIDADRLQVSHIVGNAFGSVIANSGSDRAIDTMTTVSLSLNGVTPDNLGSSMMQVDALALDATRALVVR